MRAEKRSSLGRKKLMRGAWSPEDLEELRVKVKADYEKQTDIRYGAARGWVDAIIQPHETRQVLSKLLGYVSRPAAHAHFHTGVIQV